MTEAPDTQRWFVEHLLADAERLAVVVDSVAPSTPVPACPDWDLATLTRHLGRVHRWARFCVLHPDRRPTDDEAAAMEDVDTERPGDWLRRGAGELAAVLRTLDPEAVTWHPFPAVEHVARVWPRRMAQETALHRWDAQQAAGAPDPIDAGLAADGVDEYFRLVVPRRVVRDGLTPPAGRLAVRCEDTPGAWLVHGDGDAIVVAGGTSGADVAADDADAELRGPAEDLLLLLWGRTAADAAEVTVTGDAPTARGWLAVAGM